MTLSNHRLEEIHSELCAELWEREEELSRTKVKDRVRAAEALERIATEIENWRNDAKKVGAENGPESRNAVVDLVERSRRILLRLSELPGVYGS